MDLIFLSEDMVTFMVTKTGIERLEGFSEFNFSTGAKSYIRQYYSDANQKDDIVGTGCEISYTFDRMKNNQVQDSLAEIADFSLVGGDSVKDFVFVDLTKKSEGRYPAIKQSFTVKCTDRRPENGFLDYSGQLIARGELIKGEAALSADLKSCEFIPERSGILCD